MYLNYEIEGVINFMYRGFEIKEALRAQMEVQSKLHLQVEVNLIFLVQVVYLIRLNKLFSHIGNLMLVSFIFILSVIEAIWYHTAGGEALADSPGCREEIHGHA